MTAVEIAKTKDITTWEMMRDCFLIKRHMKDRGSASWGHVKFYKDMFSPFRLKEETENV